MARRFATQIGAIRANQSIRRNIPIFRTFERFSRIARNLRFAIFSAPKCRLCRACRSAAVKISPETVHESCHRKCREICGEISLLLVPQETKLENAQNFSRQVSQRFSRDVSQLQMPNFMAFFILQTFVLEKCNSQEKGSAVGEP